MVLQVVILVPETGAHILCLVVVAKWGTNYGISHVTRSHVSKRKIMIPGRRVRDGYEDVLDLVVVAD